MLLFDVVGLLRLLSVYVVVSCDKVFLEDDVVDISCYL